MDLKTLSSIDLPPTVSKYKGKEAISLSLILVFNLDSYCLLITWMDLLNEYTGRLSRSPPSRKNDAFRNTVCSTRWLRHCLRHAESDPSNPFSLWSGWIPLEFDKDCSWSDLFDVIIFASRFKRGDDCGGEEVRGRLWCMLCLPSCRRDFTLWIDTVYLSIYLFKWKIQCGHEVRASANSGMWLIGEVISCWGMYAHFNSNGFLVVFPPPFPHL